MIQIQMSTAQQDVVQMCQWLLSLAVPGFVLFVFNIPFSTNNLGKGTLEAKPRSTKGNKKISQINPYRNLGSLY